jgi:hypothetical protein
MALRFVGKGLAKKYQELARKMPSLVDDTMRSIAEDAKSDFEKTTETWKNKPRFDVVKQTRSYNVTTQDAVYAYVDKGTKPHRIRPVNANVLAFQGGYQAKTTPRVIASRSGGPSGPVVFSVGVMHPGTEARQFTKTILDKWQKKVAPTMRIALKGGLESVGL